MHLETFEKGKGRRVWLNEKERDHLIAVYQRDTRRRIGLALMVRCGLRCQEAVDARPEDLFHDIESGRDFIRITYQKDSKNRKTPIPDSLVERIQRYTADQNPTEPILGVSTRTLRRWVEHAGDELRAETRDDRWRYVRPHDLRRTWGLLTLESGIHPSVVMKWGGWDDYETFQNQYLRVHSDRVQAKEAEKFEPRAVEDSDTNPEGFDSAILDFVDRSRRILQTQPWTDEANTKAKIVRPFIELLGWDVLSQDVALEYSEVGSEVSQRVDYALFGNGRPQVMVEAKRQDDSLGTPEIGQLKGYMRIHQCGCGLLTNGRRYIVFLDQQNSKLSEMDRVIDCELQELLDHRLELTPLLKT